MTSRRSTPGALAVLLLAVAFLAGCASPSESGDDPAGVGAVCAPGTEQGGESGHEPGTTGSGTGDTATADGGDPTRPTVADPCGPGGGAVGDGASTGLGEPGGGRSTDPQS